VDLVVPPADERLVSAVIQAACLAAADRGADSVSCFYIGAWLGNALRRNGFYARTPERYFLVRPGPLTAAERERILQEANWYITQGDSDIGRP